MVGNGSFGVVYKALCTTTNQTVAIKKVLQDKRFKNRELAIMKLLRHTNVVHMRHSFYHHQQRDNKQQREENDNNNIIINGAPSDCTSFNEWNRLLRGRPDPG